MKKSIALLFVAVLSLGVLSGCGNSVKVVDESNSSSVEQLGNLMSFSTTDMNKKEVTQDIFKDFDVTMVNIWGTWCKPCVEELPALSKLYEQLPEKTNMITICEDADKEEELAGTILSNIGGGFQTLKSNNSIDKSLLNNIQVFPTTIFVNSNGEIVGDIIKGKLSGGDDILIAHYLEGLDGALELVGTADE